MKYNYKHKRRKPMKFEALNINGIKDKDIENISKNYPKRYVKAQHFQKNEDFLRCIGGYVLLTKMIGDFSEDDVIYGNDGKPSISGKEFFNISHSGDFVVVATGDAEIGIDIEIVKERKIDISKKVFTKSELDWMNLDPLSRFHILWTQKESVIKLLGTGIKTPLNSFEVLPFENEETISFGNIKISNYTFVFEDDYIVSICQKI